MNAGHICVLGSVALPWSLSFHQEGPLSAPIGVEGTAFLSTKLALNQSWPDLQLMFVSTHPGFDGGTLYKDFLQIKDEVTSTSCT